MTMKMTDSMNNTFTPEEVGVITDIQFFELKERVTQKILDALNHAQQGILASSVHEAFAYPHRMDAAIGKVSKGEQYKGYPYMVLDFPRLFAQSGVFAFRTMVWWGHAAYFTLHLSGKYLALHREAIVRNWSSLKGQGVYIYQDTQDVWHHEVESPFYESVDAVEASHLERWCEEFDYLKLACRLELSALDDLSKASVAAYELFFGVLR